MFEVVFFLHAPSYRTGPLVESALTQALLISLAARVISLKCHFRSTNQHKRRQLCLHFPLHMKVSVKFVGLSDYLDIFKNLC